MRCSGVVVWLRLLPLLFAPLFGAAAQAQDCTSAHTLAQAERTVVQGTQTLDTRRVTQLDHLERAWLREDVRIHYRIDLGGCAPPALWIYRLGAPYRIDADGKPLTPIQPAAPADQVYNGRVPALFELPPGARSLHIELVSLPYVPSGLIRLEAAPIALLLPSRLLDVSVATGFNDASSAIILVVSLLALSMWLLRRSEFALLWFGLACVLWAARGAVYLRFVVPGSALLAEHWNPLAVLWTCAAITVSVWHTLGRVRRRDVGVVCASVLLLTVASGVVIALERGNAAARGVSFLTGFGLFASVMWKLARQNVLSREQSWTMQIGFISLMLGAAHDMAMVLGWIPPDRWTAITPAFTIMLLCYTVAVSRYLVRHLGRAERANEELEAVIATKTAELEGSYRLLQARDHERVRTQEREHLLRDMHDGLGAQLMTVLRGVERGSLPREQILQALQDGLDDLRLLMDSTDLGRELSGALVAWRSRWTPRLSALGLDMVWVLDDGLDDPTQPLHIAPDTVLQIMRILQEAVVNIVKHASATQIVVRTLVENPAPLGAEASASVPVAGRVFQLTVTDNGCGLPPNGVRPRGARGLSNMASRADKIGATLSVTDLAAPDQGVRVALWLVL